MRGFSDYNIKHVQGDTSVLGRAAAAHGWTTASGHSVYVPRFKTVFGDLAQQGGHKSSEGAAVGLLRGGGADFSEQGRI